MNKDIYIQCECKLPDHLFHFNYIDGDNYDVGNVVLSVQLRQYRNIFQRIWTAIKYVFKMNQAYGHWDCTCMEYPDVVRIRNFFIDAVLEMEKDPRYKHHDPEFVEKVYEDYWMHADPKYGKAMDKK